MPSLAALACLVLSQLELTEVLVDKCILDCTHLLDAKVLRKEHYSSKLKETVKSIEYYYVSEAFDDCQFSDIYYN